MSYNLLYYMFNSCHADFVVSVRSLTFASLFPIFCVPIIVLRIVHVSPVSVLHSSSSCLQQVFFSIRKIFVNLFLYVLQRLSEIITFFIEMLSARFLIYAFLGLLITNFVSYRFVFSRYIIILTGQASLQMLLSICINCKYAKLWFSSFSTFHGLSLVQICLKHHRLIFCYISLLDLYFF